MRVAAPFIRPPSFLRQPGEIDAEREAQLNNIVGMATPFGLSPFPETGIAGLSHGLANALAPIAQQILYKHQIEQQQEKQRQMGEDRLAAQTQQEFSNFSSLYELVGQNGGAVAQAELIQNPHSQALFEKLGFPKGSVKHDLWDTLEHIPGVISGGRVNREKLSDYFADLLPKTTTEQKTTLPGIGIMPGGVGSIATQRDLTPDELKRKQLDIEGTPKYQQYQQLIKATGLPNAVKQRFAELDKMIVGRSREIYQISKEARQAGSAEEFDAINNEYKRLTGGIGMLGRPPFTTIRKASGITPEMQQEAGLTDEYLDREVNPNTPQGSSQINEASRMAVSLRRGKTSEIRNIRSNITRLTTSLANLDRGMTSQYFRALRDFSRDATREHLGEASRAMRAIQIHLDEIKEVSGILKNDGVAAAEIISKSFEPLDRTLSNIYDRYNAEVERINRSDTPNYRGMQGILGEFEQQAKQMLAAKKDMEKPLQAEIDRLRQQEERLTGVKTESGNIQTQDIVQPTITEIAPAISYTNKIEKFASNRINNLSKMADDLSRPGTAKALNIGAVSTVTKGGSITNLDGIKRTFPSGSVFIEPEGSVGIHGLLVFKGQNGKPVILSDLDEAEIDDLKDNYIVKPSAISAGTTQRISQPSWISSARDMVLERQRAGIAARNAGKLSGKGSANTELQRQKFEAQTKSKIQTDVQKEADKRAEANRVRTGDKLTRFYDESANDKAKVELFGTTHKTLNSDELAKVREYKKKYGLYGKTATPAKRLGGSEVLTPEEKKKKAIEEEKRAAGKSFTGGAIGVVGR